VEAGSNWRLEMQENVEIDWASGKRRGRQTGSWSAAPSSMNEVLSL
jgi:hypothetical protein